LKRDADRIELNIQDDGVGFDSSGASTRQGNGLRNMNERATKLGGNFQVQSVVGKGTDIRVSIPLASEKIAL
jgi:signal transduction histidine kinase